MIYLSNMSKGALPLNTVGYVISHKNGENRRALFPNECLQLRHPERAVFETGYGAALGFSDEEYRQTGVKIGSREDALSCDVIVDVKLGDADFMDALAPGKVLCGWAHTVQKTVFAGKAIRAGHTVIALEHLKEHGRYLFYRNREIAGEAAILHAFRYCGKMPYDCKVCILGNGQTAKGAMRMLTALGAEVDIFGRKMEKTFRRLMFQYDVIVNCVYWDTSRTDRLIYREDLKAMRPGTMIVDVSCDPYLEIETSHPTTIDDPVYTVDGVIHYAVDNTPAMYPHTVSKVFSRSFLKYADALAAGHYPENLRRAIDLDRGRIVNPEIRSFREARGLFCE